MKELQYAIYSDNVSTTKKKKKTRKRMVSKYFGDTKLILLLRIFLCVNGTK